MGASAPFSSKNLTSFMNDYLEVPHLPPLKVLQKEKFILFELN